jgi:hypothetical protein
MDYPEPVWQTRTRPEEHWMTTYGSPVESLDNVCSQVAVVAISI